MDKIKDKDIQIVNADEKKDKAKKKSNLIKNSLYLVFIILITALVVFLSCKDNFNEIIGLFTNMNFGYFAILMGLVLLHFMINSLILFLFVKLFQNNYHYPSALANNAVGVFYSDISPGGSGGQFVQIYTFSKQGVPFAHSASVLIMQYIVYNVCLVFQAIFCFVSHYQDFLDIQTIDLVINGVTIPIPILIFIIIGFGLTLAVVVILFVAAFSKRLHKFVCGPCITFLGKIRILKHPEDTRIKVKTSIENFRVEFRRLISNIRFTIYSVLLTFLGLFVVESLPFFCGLSLNAFAEINTAQQFFDKLFTSISYTNMHQMACGLLPLPGSSGVSEFAFLRFFEGYFDAPGFNSGAGINAVMLLWRFSTFIIPFFVCGLVSAIYKPKGTTTRNRFEHCEQQNYLTVKIDMFNEAEDNYEQDIKKTEDKVIDNESEKKEDNNESNK